MSEASYTISELKRRHEALAKKRERAQKSYEALLAQEQALDCAISYLETDTKDSASNGKSKTKHTELIHEAVKACSEYQFNSSHVKTWIAENKPGVSVDASTVSNVLKSMLTQGTITEVTGASGRTPAEYKVSQT